MHRRALLAHVIPGWPERLLFELREKALCSSCGSKNVEIAEVIWCQEMKSWPKPDFPPAAQEPGAAQE